jgi:hypothetical protein
MNDDPDVVYRETAAAIFQRLTNALFDRGHGGGPDDAPTQALRKQTVELSHTPQLYATDGSVSPTGC